MVVIMEFSESVALVFCIVERLQRKDRSYRWVYTLEALTSGSSCCDAAWTFVNIVYNASCRSRYGGTNSVFTSQLGVGMGSVREARGDLSVDCSSGVQCLWDAPSQPLGSSGLDSFSPLSALLVVWMWWVCIVLAFVHFPIAMGTALRQFIRRQRIYICAQIRIQHEVLHKFCD